jgi:hypothetical protein
MVTTKLTIVKTIVPSLYLCLYIDSRNGNQEDLIVVPLQNPALRLRADNPIIDQRGDLRGKVSPLINVSN